MSKRAVTPLLIAISMSFGVMLGVNLSSSRDANGSVGRNKIDQILRYVENDYVDTVSRETLEDEVIAYLLQRLDPHSYYISEEDVAAMTEPLEGGFEGIGVQFNMFSDTVYVINVIANGPSEKAGVQPGDRILQVGETVIAGQNLGTQEIMNLLKGEKGSEVSVKVLREDAVIAMTIVRDEIPLNSIDAAYLINDSTIYVRLSRFSKTTMDEFRQRVYPLRSQSTRRFILDLRSNGGGYLDAAVGLADEFLPGNMLITYTEGKSRPKIEYRSSVQGRFEEMDLAVLIDGYSASASEIFAGAIQDHKRGTIFGKRSFGKGLVQEQSEWEDGSATRLTVARYYTPLGRSIQRPYESFSSSDEYFSHGSDSTHDGGIIPDVVVKRDTAGVTWLYAEIVHRGLISDFVYRYRDAHWNEWKNWSADEFIENVQDEELLDGLRAFLVSREMEVNESEWSRSARLMAVRCKALMARSIFDDEAYYRIFNPTDEVIRAALEGIKKPD